MGYFYANLLVCTFHGGIVVGIPTCSARVSRLTHLWHGLCMFTFILVSSRHCNIRQYPNLVNRAPRPTVTLTDLGTRTRGRYTICATWIRGSHYFHLKAASYCAIRLHVRVHSHIVAAVFGMKSCLLLQQMTELGFT